MTKANSPIITKKVVLTAKEAGGKDYQSCVVYCLLVCHRWFKRQAALELWDADLHDVRATACEVLAKIMYVKKKTLQLQLSLYPNNPLKTISSNSLSLSLSLSAASKPKKTKTTSCKRPC